MNPHHLLHLKILYPVGPIFFSSNVVLLYNHVSKILEDLSQLCPNLATFSAVWGKAVSPKHTRGGLSILEMLSWRSHTQFVTRKAANRRGYINKHHHHTTNLDVSVFIFALEIAKGDNYWCKTRHWPYFWTAFFSHINPRVPPWDLHYDRVSTTRQTPQPLVNL